MVEPQIQYRHGRPGGCALEGGSVPGRTCACTSKQSEPQASRCHRRLTGPVSWARAWSARSARPGGQSSSCRTRPARRPRVNRTHDRVEVPRGKISDSQNRDRKTSARSPVAGSVSPPLFSGHDDCFVVVRRMRIGPFMFATARGVVFRRGSSQRHSSSNRTAPGWAALVAVAVLAVIVLCLFLSLFLA